MNCIALSRAAGHRYFRSRQQIVEFRLVWVGNGREFELVQRLEASRVDLPAEKVLASWLHRIYPYTNEAISNNMLLHFDLEKTASELYGFDFDQEG